MTGEALWGTFLTTNIPPKNLEALAYDLYYTRPPRKDSIPAIVGLSERLNMKPEFTFHALNTDPGEATLKGLAADYNDRKTWGTTRKTTQAYLARIAQRIGIIKDASQKAPPPPTPPAPPVRTDVSPVAGVTKARPFAMKHAPLSPSPKFANTSEAVSHSLFMVIVGGIVYFLVGFSRYAQIPFRRPKMA